MRWKLSTARMVRLLKDWQIRMDTDNGWWVMRKVGDGEVRSKGEGRKCDLDQKMFLHSDLLKLCLKQNGDITKFFPDTIVFLDENNSHYKAVE